MGALRALAASQVIIRLMPKFTVPDREILSSALVGLQQQLAEINDKIAGIRRDLGLRGPAAAVVDTSAVPAKRRRLSAAARRRIAAAQKKRWAEFHKAKPAA